MEPIRCPQKKILIYNLLTLYRKNMYIKEKMALMPIPGVGQSVETLRGGFDLTKSLTDLLFIPTRIEVRA